MAPPTSACAHCLGWSDGPRRTILHPTQPRRASTEPRRAANPPYASAVSLRRVCTEPSNPFGRPNNRLGSRFSPLVNPNQCSVRRSHSLGRPSNWPVRLRRASTEPRRASTEASGASTEASRTSTEPRGASAEASRTSTEPPRASTQASGTPPEPRRPFPPSPRPPRPNGGEKRTWGASAARGMRGFPRPIARPAHPRRLTAPTGRTCGAPQRRSWYRGGPARGPCCKFHRTCAIVIRRRESSLRRCRCEQGCCT